MSTLMIVSFVIMIATALLGVVLTLSLCRIASIADSIIDEIENTAKQVSNNEK